MKEKLKQELPFSLGNFIWRVTVPMAVLLAIGFLMDKIVRTTHLFEFSAILFSLCLTAWSIRASFREQKLPQVETEKE